jgi:hypothetical protein
MRIERGSPASVDIGPGAVTLGVVRDTPYVPCDAVMKAVE